MRLFEISSSGFVFTRSLHRQESRVLCLAWHQSGELIVVGGIDSALRIVNVSSANCTQRVSLDDYKQRSTLVWDVKFIDESSIITANSLGKVQVWNFEHGTLANTFNQHSADVLTLTVQMGGSGNATVFASGVDSKIIKLCKVSAGEDDGTEGKEWKWILSGQIRPHQHDVSSLDISPTGMLASGGNEGELVITNAYQFSKSAYVRHQPFPCMARHFKLAEKGSLLLHQDISTLSMWHISKLCMSSSTILNSCANIETKRMKISDIGSSLDCPNSHTDLSVEKPTPHCLLELKAKPPHNILSSTISDDGSLIAVSNVYEMWIYRFNIVTLRLLLVANLPYPSFAMLFISNRCELLSATIKEGLKRVTFDKHNRIKVDPALDGVRQKSMQQIKHFELSADGQYLAVITGSWRVTLFNVVTGTLMVELPKLQSLPVVCTFNPARPELLLFAGGESREVFVYNVTDDSLRCLGRVRMGIKGDIYEGRTKFSHPLAILPIAFEDNLFAVYDNDCTMMFRLTSDSTRSPAKPPIGKCAEKPQLPDNRLPAQLIKSTSLVLFVGTFNHSFKPKCSQAMVCGTGREEGQGLVIVERSWKDILQALPPILYRKRFGT